MLDIEDGKGGDMVEFNRLEKEMEKRERATVLMLRWMKLIMQLTPC